MGLYGSYDALLHQLLPPGRAFDGPSTTSVGGLITALSDELERVDGRAQDLLSEALPATAYEMTAEWAEALDCDESLIEARYAFRLKQDEQTYQEAAASVGYTSGVTFTYYTDEYYFRCNSDCNDSCYTWPWRSVIVVDAVVPGEGDSADLQDLFESMIQLHQAIEWGTL